MTSCISPKKTTKEYIEEIYELLGEEYTILGEYETNKTKILTRHNVCGYEYYVRPNDILSRGRRCPKCANIIRGMTRKKDTTIFKQEVYDLVGEEYTVLGEYKTNKTKILVSHNICGNKYEVRPNDFQQGYRCPECNNLYKESFAIKEIKNFLNENNIRYECEIIFDECKNQRHLPFDFYIKTDLSSVGFILIEFDGIQHFKAKGFISEEKVIKTQINDRIKDEFCKQYGIPLLRIAFNENYIKILNKFLRCFLLV